MAAGSGGFNHFKKLAAEAEERVTHVLDAGAAKVLSDSIQRAPFRDGALRTSGAMRRTSVRNRWVYFTAAHAAAQEFGAAPHVIEARSAGILANPATGQVFGRRVYHPGNAAQPFLVPAVEANRDWITRGLVNATKGGKL